MKVICCGDSNTYGYDPRSYIGGRYSVESRWVDLLREKTGWQIENQGENGRMIPRFPLTVPEDTGLLVVMLGTNACCNTVLRCRRQSAWKNFWQALLLRGSASC